MVHQCFRMFSVTCSHSFGIWELVEPWKKELWSCYRPLHTAQPLSTMTSSEAYAASLCTLFARRDTCSNYRGYMRNEVANKDFYACLMMYKSYLTSESNTHLCESAGQLIRNYAFQPICQEPPNTLWHINH